MEIISIKNDAKRAIISLCNQAVTLEYDMIVNYPRIIDHIRNFEKIEDAQLHKDIESLGVESLLHFNKTEKIIESLGGDMEWEAGMLPRLVGVEDSLGMQLEKEKQALDLYTKCRQIARNNRIKVKTGGLINSILGRNTPERVIVSYEQTVADLDRLISDEERHITLVEDIIATHKSLISKKH